MLLQNLKKVVELDNRISDMHRQLANLYTERSNIVDAGETIFNSNDTLSAETTKAPTRAKSKSHDIWAQKEYASLSTAWKRYGVEIPTFISLKTRLMKARITMDELSNEQSELMGRLAVILVPPAKKLEFPVNSMLREKQGFCDLQDYVNQDLIVPASKKQWRMLVVYVNNAGLGLGAPTSILEEKKYRIAGHDTRGLGIIEYAALTLQREEPLDNGAWTLLLKDYSGSERIPSATYMNGRFRFDIDEVGGVLENDCFRPAVEIH